MILFQLIIFLSIVISGALFGNKTSKFVTNFWLIFTVIEVVMPYLMIIQIITIILANNVVHSIRS